MKFDGKEFYVAGWKHRKTDAEKLANHIRERNGLARILKEKNDGNNQIGYTVYRRGGY